jgi:hypothetical protein
MGPVGLALEIALAPQGSATRGKYLLPTTQPSPPAAAHVRFWRWPPLIRQQLDLRRLSLDH